MKGTLLDSVKRKAGRIVSFITAVSILWAITACDQAPGPQSPTPLPQATATADVPTIMGTPLVVVEIPTLDPRISIPSVPPVLLTAYAPRISAVSPQELATSITAFNEAFSTREAVTTSPTVEAGCTPTNPDAEGPFYKPNAPERTSVGKGHVLNGVVKSTRDCAPILGAKIEFWQVNPNGQYDDDHRATMYAGTSGVYSFESNFPPSYENRPPHIHVRVSAQGYHTLITQYYPKDVE